jgi:hypothetical protein
VAERKEEKTLAASAGPYKHGRAARGQHVDSLASAKQLLVAADEPRSSQKDTGGACRLARFGKNYKTAIDSIFQITQKFSKELENLQIQKF